jgi:anti-sigma-K factor RskA
VNADEIRELAAVYALGALDGDDLARFEELLRSGDREAASALHEFDATLAELAAEAADAPTALGEMPPAGAKALVMQRIASAPARAADPVVRPLTPRAPRRSWWPAVWAAAAAAGLAGIIVGASMSATYENRLQALAREASELKGLLQRQQAEIDRQRAILALIRDPATQVVALAGLEPAPSARARMIWNAPQGGLLVAAGLPRAPEGKAYQLWAIAGKGAPVSAGVFDVDAEGRGSLTVSPLPGVAKVDVFAVTLEPAGGLAAPSGQMFLAGKS